MSTTASFSVLVRFYPCSHFSASSTVGSTITLHIRPGPAIAMTQPLLVVRIAWCVHSLPHLASTTQPSNAAHFDALVRELTELYEQPLLAGPAKTYQCGAQGDTAKCLSGTCGHGSILTGQISADVHRALPFTTAREQKRLQWCR